MRRQQLNSWLAAHGTPAPLPYHVHQVVSFALSQARSSIHLPAPLEDFSVSQQSPSQLTIHLSFSSPLAAHRSSISIFSFSSTVLAITFDSGALLMNQSALLYPLESFSASILLSIILFLSAHA